MDDNYVVSEKTILEHLQRKGLTLGNAHLIVQALREHMDIDLLTKHSYDYRQLRELMDGLSQGLDITKYSSPLFSGDKMCLIKEALESGTDVNCILDPALDTKQMTAILRCQEIGVDDNIFRVNPTTAEHYSTIIQLLVYGEIPDLSWVKPGISEKKFDLLLKALQDGYLKAEMVDMKDEDLVQHLKNIRKKDCIKEAYAYGNLKRFSVFNDLEV